MNGTPHHPGGNESDSFEATLQVIAHVPVPEGIEERVHAALAAAPPQARVWPWSSPWAEGSWTAVCMRAAAAAAIVVVVAGGGWGVYTRVQHQTGKVVIVPAGAGMPAAGGFSSAGAIRTPQTVQGPVLTTAQKKRPVKSAVAKEHVAHRAGEAAGGSAAQAVGR